MNNILEMIKNERVEWKKLETLIDYEQPTKYIVKSTEYDDRFDTPVLTAGQTFILGFTDELENIYKADENNPVIIFDDFTAGNHWVDFNFKVKSSAMKILKPKEGVNFRYCYHYLKTIHIDISEHKRVWLSKFSKIEIPIPSMETQEKIVKILDAMVDHFTQLQAELQARNKQYEYYRDKLLSEEYLNKLVNKYNFDEYKDYDVKKITLDELFEIKNGYTPSKRKKEYWENGSVPWFRMEDLRENGNVLNDSILKVNQSAIKKSLFKKNSLILSTSATIGEYALIKVDFIANQRFTIFTLKDTFSKMVSIDYLYYYFYLVGNWCKNNVNIGNFASVDVEILKNNKILIPPIPVQEHIVSILDNFNKIVTDINEGLPKEIELRQKQYEYYRERLLDFKREED